jgi:hypothetical protein
MLFDLGVEGKRLRGYCLIAEACALPSRKRRSLCLPVTLSWQTIWCRNIVACNQQKRSGSGGRSDLFFWCDKPVGR